jgi:hypothetical protein
LPAVANRDGFKVIGLFLPFAHAPRAPEQRPGDKAA